MTDEVEADDARTSHLPAYTEQQARERPATFTRQRSSFYNKLIFRPRPISSRAPDTRRTLHSVYPADTGWATLIIQFLHLALMIIGHYAIPVLSFQLFSCADDNDNNNQALQCDLGDIRAIRTIDYSLADLIVQAIGNGATHFGIGVALFGIVLPYVIWITAVVVWYFPLTSRKRSLLLRWLSRLSKWPLVAPFSVVLLAEASQLLNDQPSPSEPVFAVGVTAMQGTLVLYLSVLWGILFNVWVFDMHYRATILIAQGAKPRSEVLLQRSQQRPRKSVNSHVSLLKAPTDDTYEFESILTTKDTTSGSMLGLESAARLTPSPFQSEASATMRRKLSAKRKDAAPPPPPPIPCCGCQLLCVNRVPFDPALGPSVQVGSSVLEGSLLNQGVFFRGKRMYQFSKLGWMLFVCGLTAMVVLYTTALLVPVLHGKASVKPISGVNVSIPNFGTFNNEELVEFELGEFTLVSLGISNKRSDEFLFRGVWESIDMFIYGCLVFAVPYISFAFIIVGAVIPLNRICSSHPTVTHYQRLAYEAVTVVSSFVAFDVLVFTLLLCFRTSEVPTVFDGYPSDDSLSEQPLNNGTHLQTPGHVTVANEPLPHIVVVLSAVLLYWVAEYMYIFLGRRMYRMRVGGKEKRAHKGGEVTWRARKEGQCVGVGLYFNLLTLSVQDMEKPRDPREYEFNWDQHFALFKGQVQTSDTEKNQVGLTDPVKCSDEGGRQSIFNLAVVIE